MRRDAMRRQPGRRGFDHLHAELSVAAGRLVPRYALWLRLREGGADPEHLTREQALAFCRRDLPGFLGDLGLSLPRGAARRVEREMGRFDPHRPTPAERIARV